MKLSGVIPPIATPLTDGDRVDEAGLRKLNRYLLDAGVNAIFANGSMGGFAFLDNDEQVRSVGITVSEVNRRVPVMGGIGDTSTNRAVKLAKRIAAEGVDYLSILPPFYYLANQDHLIAYFSDIAAAVDIPVVVYENPVLTKNSIQPETIARLHAAIPRLKGVKISNADQAYVQTVLTLMKGASDFSVLTGHEFLLLVGLQLGCAGYVGGVHNLCPHMAVALYRAFQEGDIAQAAKLQQDLIATWQVFKYGSIWGGFDEALRYLGICQRATGHPYVSSVTEEDRRAVHAILEAQVKPYL
jgi:4-hydroxy-tetrahydrodipicolinate synthase